MAIKPPIAGTWRPSIKSKKEKPFAENGVVDLGTGEWINLDEEEVVKENLAFKAINALSSIRPLTYQDIVEENWPYEPFLINRAFSLSEDTVKAAAQMNEHPTLTKDMHAAYYIHSVRPRERFKRKADGTTQKWPKLLDDPEVKIIAQYYGLSIREAKLHLHLHTKEQVNMMRRALEEGARPSRFY